MAHDCDATIVTGKLVQQSGACAAPLPLQRRRGVADSGLSICIGLQRREQ